MIFYKTKFLRILYICHKLFSTILNMKLQIMLELLQMLLILKKMKIILLKVFFFQKQNCLNF